MHEDNLERARALDDRLATAGILGSLAAIAIDQGRIPDAMSLMGENAAILHDMRDLMGISENLCRMAKALTVAGRAATAAQVLGCFEALTEEAGGAESWVLRETEETLTTLREQLDDQSLAEAMAKGRRLSPADAMSLGFDSGL